jgi:excisionase family DNA binding protein
MWPGARFVNQILTAEQLAARWQVTTAWIYRKVREGELPTVPLPGRVVRFRADQIEAFELGQLNSTDGKT